jgi:hypothetical protein
MRIFCGFYAKGQEFVRIRLRVKVPECVQNSEGSHAQIKGNYHETNAKDKISYLFPKFQHT